MKTMTEDKKQLMEALHSMVEQGKHGEAMIEAWMNNPTGSSATFSAEVERKRRKTENDTRRKGSIFASVDLGDAPPPLNLQLMSGRLQASFEDFEDKRIRDLSMAQGASPEVSEVIEASLVINQMIRRFHVLEGTMKDLSLENFQNCMKLKICAKEFKASEEHWRTVNVNLSKAAREESASLKQVRKKKGRRRGGDRTRRSCWEEP
jgi:hypothetical protein